ncbi:Mannosyl-glycoprotein endo-beta-N-acetylglucosaminidase [Thermosyntropha lipolytica DSM 11003]|uniref:Mannosyl-glycoprotein endo-beta-N-acetylglucosaminidase n=1 Tax=Thermosyntropha lipolytica DSM 11003 TaxID=1123382 RepID=A0A1M5M5S5_9FIRM|nr:stalk domain-containing protein [Thermosyntropha lipolytica]SHG72616.1 Mannosyl-glycoprotein endo-beta-N-acetylglucosaminidase [Thermosyntropha lipolytica DSM 11003]
MAKYRHSLVGAGIVIAVILFISAFFYISYPVEARTALQVYVNGQKIESDVPAQIIGGRTMLPVRAVAEALGFRVEWDEREYKVYITSGAGGSYDLPAIDMNIPIMGEPVATAEQLRKLLRQNNPNAPDLVDLYLQIGREYGVRGDIAFCQAAKETGWWRYGGLVRPEQNNYCGLGATGRAATGEEDLRGADPNLVWYEAGKHGAFFATPAVGVEAHIQHLYAYATDAPLPPGKKLVDPRFTLVKRGVAKYWTDLNGRWAVPGNGYGESILNDYYRKALAIGNSGTGYTDDKIRALQIENELLKAEIVRLKRELETKSK